MNWGLDLRVLGISVQTSGFRVSRSLRVLGVGVRVLDFRFRVWHVAYSVWSLGIRVTGGEFRV